MTVLLQNLLNESDDANSSYILGLFGVALYNMDNGDIMDNTTYAVKMALSIYLGIAMVVSVIGNVCTCTVIANDRRMRTPTNCYLGNLAITDLMISLFIPLEIYIIWMPDFYPFGGLGCRLHFVLLDIFCNCNVLTITAFTVERYIVVSRPFLQQKLSITSRVFKIIGVIWAISLSFCLPDIFSIDVIERKKYVFCYYTLTDIVSIFMGIELLLFFVTPMVVVIVLYLLIAVLLYSAHNKLKRRPFNSRINRDKAVRMLAAIAASFFFFWSPYFLMRLMMMYPHFEYKDDNQTIWKIANIICYNGYMSTALNPILYSLLSQKFRQAFKSLLRGRRILHRNENRRSIIEQSELKHSTTVTRGL